MVTAMIICRQTLAGVGRAYIKSEARRHQMSVFGQANLSVSRIYTAHFSYVLTSDWAWRLEGASGNEEHQGQEPHFRRRQHPPKLLYSRNHYPTPLSINQLDGTDA